MNIDDFIKHIEESWEEEKSEIVDKENRWYISDIEKEYYINKCLNNRMTLSEINIVLKKMGY